MRMTLRDCLSDCLIALKKMTGQRDKWVRDWPGQVHLSLDFPSPILLNPCHWVVVVISCFKAHKLYLISNL